MNKICIIPVREGSQRVKLKNFRVFDEAKNQSLLDRKIEQLKEFYTNSEIIISSSSSMAYETANKHSVKFSKRIDKYSNSTTPWPAVVNHILTNIDSPPETIVTWALCTSPFFSRYQEAFNSFVSNDSKDSLISVYKRRTFFLKKDGTPINFNPSFWHPYSQQLEPYYEITGACFIATLHDMLKWSYWFGPNPYLLETDYFESLDIDEIADFNASTKLLAIENV